VALAAKAVAVSRFTAFLLALALLPDSGCRRRHLSRGDAAVVVVAPRNDAAAPRSTAESEPNDSPEQAQLLSFNAEWPVVDLEGSLSGQSECEDGKDVDMFKVVVPGGTAQERPVLVPDSSQPDDARRTARRLNLEIAADAGRGMSLQLLDERLKVLGSVVAEGGQGAGMPNMAVQPGQTYYFRIKAAGRSGKPGGSPGQCSYKLSLQLGDFDVAEEREPNDSSEAAETVEMAGMAELAGYYGWPHDQDFYRLHSPEVASALEVTVDAVEGVAPGLQVLAGNGARLAAAKGRKGEKLALHNVLIAGAAVDAGAASSFFYVVVKAEAGQNRRQRYILHLSFGAFRQNIEAEPNDLVGSASPIRDGTTSGFLPAGDVDFFLYDSTEPREISIDVSFPARVRGRVDVSRMAGKPEVLATAETKKARQQIAISKILSLGHPVLLRIAPIKSDGNANEAYSIQISSSPGMGNGQLPQIRVGP
jgi:hypothetical protein